jgi:NAD(P)-dependent dehydrogenase (short-subunit alcohol dehydrogenase family)
MSSILVAGGTGALGSAVLRELLDAGHRVTTTWVAGRERERVQEAFGEAGALTLVEADVMDPDAVAKAVDSVEDLAAVVNLVGGFLSGPRVHETDPEEWERMLRLNLRPGFLLARAAVPGMLERGGGAYVGVGARTALQPFAGAAAYATAKAGVITFVKALHADYGKQGLRANAILPSIIDTPANRAATPDADFSKWVQPAEIAKVIRFLVSDDSAVTSGAAIPVYGRA